MFETNADDKKYIKNYNLVENLKYIMRETWQWQKGFIFVSLLYSFTVTVNQYIPIFMPKYIIDVITKNGSRQKLIFLIITCIIIKIVSSEICDIQEKGLLWRLTHIRMKLAYLRIKKCFTMDYENMETPIVLDYMEKAKKSTHEEVQMLGGGAIPSADENTVGIMGLYRNFSVLLMNLFSLFFSGVLIVFVNPYIVITMFLLALCSFKALDQAKKEDAEKFWNVIADKWRRIGYLRTVTKDFGYAKDIRVYNLMEWLNKKQKDVNRQTHEMYKVHYFRWIKFAALMQIFTAIQEIVLYVWLIYCVLRMNMPIGDFVMYLGIVKMFSANALSLFDTLTTMRRQSIETNDYRTFIEFPDRIDESTLETIEKEELNLKSNVQYEFKFEHVSFRYPGQKNYVLKDLNFDIKDGQKLAIVGVNGVGKTTLLKLLMRLYEPSEGRILLNGKDIRTYKKESYYKVFAPVFQNVESFAFSLGQNVSMKEENQTDYALAEKSICKAGLENKVKALPRGIKTEILKFLHKEGIELSGGEKQKMALARALYKDAPVIILDEPTAALDPIAEYTMYTNFNSIVKEKTTIFISHRLSSTRFCDSIIVLSNGGIVEQGTHETLLRSNGLYTDLFEKQARYYKESNIENPD